MQRLSSLVLFSILLAFSACKSHAKKILVYASSNIQVDPATQKSITVSDGTTHHEQTLDFTGGDPVTLNIQSSSGKYTLEASEDGLFIANLKNDTVIGSFQRVGSDNGEATITQDALKQKLDSLQKLMVGENVSAAGRNFFIVPGKIVKITSELNAKVFGPYTKIPGAFDAGSVPEIYKFYSIKEIREIVGNLTKMTQSIIQTVPDTPAKK